MKATTKRTRDRGQREPVTMLDAAKLVGVERAEGRVYENGEIHGRPDVREKA